MITIEQLTKAILDLKESQKKTDEQLAKTDKQLAKTDEQLAKTDKTMRDSFKELERVMKETSKELGGIGRSQGEVAEEYFYNSLDAKKEINKIKFDFIAQNIYNKIGNLEGKYDIVLTNGNTIGIIETKYKLQDKDVVKMITQQIPKFKTLYPMYKNYKLYGGLAGFKVPKGTEEKALKNGLFILKRKGEVMQSVVGKLRTY